METRSPLWLRIPVVVVLFLRIIGILKIGLSPAARSLWTELSLLLNALDIVSLFGIWSMKRWAVILFLLLEATNVAVAARYSGTPLRVQIATVVIPALPLVPAMWCWRRMTWRSRWRAPR